MPFLKTLFPAVLCIGLAAACSTPVTSPSDPAEEALLALAQRFPEFKADSGKCSDRFCLVRRVTTGDSISFEFRSFSLTPYISENDPSVLLLFNPAGRSCAIPFFSNNARDYWKFGYDPYADSVEKKIGTTFREEFCRAFHTLNLDTSLAFARMNIDALFRSALQCERVNYADSTELLKNGRRLNRNRWLTRSRWPESRDSCESRLRKGWNDMREAQWSSYYQEVFWDKDRHCVYIVSYVEEETAGHYLAGIRTYYANEPGIEISAFYIDETEL